VRATPSVQAARPASPDAVGEPGSRYALRRYLLLQRAVIREEAAEMQPATEIRMPHFTHLAAHTRNCRINRDALPNMERLIQRIVSIFADGDDFSGEFVSENHG